MGDTNRHNKTRRRDSRPSMHSVTRRAFLGATAAGAVRLCWRIWFIGALVSATGARAGDPVWIEKSIPQLQALMDSGELTSLELTRGYLKRIKELNPLLHAVIETNPGRRQSPRAWTTSAGAAACAGRSTAFRSWSRTTSRPMTRCRRRPARWRSSTAACQPMPRSSRLARGRRRRSSERPTCASGRTSAGFHRRRTSTGGAHEAARATPIC